MMPDIYKDSEMVCVKHSEMGDWCTLEWLEHEHETKFVRVSSNSSALYSSERLDPMASVEGPLYEMKQLAIVILDDNEPGLEFYRCAVEKDLKRKKVAFWSPRNSERKVWVSMLFAKALAESIMELQ